MILTLSLVLLVFLSAGIGQFAISPSNVLRGFFAYFGFTEPPKDPLIMATLWNIRFPRIALAILVGAALAVAGAVMQAIFSNPLAEPGVIGVSAGSAVGASMAIVFAPYAFGGFSVPGAAFLTGLLAAFTVYMLSFSAGKTEPLTLILTGIAVTAVATALTSIATYIAPATARDQIVFWQMGSFGAANWMQVGVVGAVVLTGLIWSVLIARKLDLLALGERAAGHVGLNVQGLRTCAIVLTALLTSAAVSYAGVIAFVGLIVPHVLRLAMGPLNSYLLPAALLGGAVLLTGADLLARTIIPFSDLPIGIFTALVGGPVFFVLLRRNLRGARKAN
ncbi:FecCD family ABC transporter permease [Arcanobacterium hippocoleae]|uniref:FecCD family ABC transporter permease n=1 Tax=Arcanobacterium hippocoleae TaxID=149017 RepID=UPI003341E33E